MWQRMFSVPVMRTVWRRELDWMLFVRITGTLGSKYPNIGFVFFLLYSINY
jgi:hypothetical protein